MRHPVILVCPDCHLEDKRSHLESNSDKDFLRCPDSECDFEMSAIDLISYVAGKGTLQ